jgi:hypothetical protein
MAHGVMALQLLLLLPAWLAACCSRVVWHRRPGARNQPISQRKSTQADAGTPMTESATGMMPAVMGDEGPGAQDPLIGPAS